MDSLLICAQGCCCYGREQRNWAGGMQAARFQGCRRHPDGERREKGTEALDWLHGSGLSDVVFHKLDVSDPSSAACVAGFVKEKFGSIYW